MREQVDVDDGHAFDLQNFLFDSGSGNYSRQL